MADFRVLLQDNDSDDEEFLGFNVEEIEAAEGRYLRNLNIMQQLEDSDIEFSDLESEDEEDSEDDVVLADIAD